jgi:hypothetical protein
VAELERENNGLRQELARRTHSGSAYAGERRARAYTSLADRPPEPVYEEARRAARLRSDDPDR